VAAASEKVPALVVSGFLGSGKTTLVRRLLEDARRTGVRVAFISNELGELGIDRALLGQGGEAFVELEGGCVCCELSDDLVQTLQMLWESVHPDRVVIETSGVALPFDTQLNFWREPVSAWIGDDMAVVVVNAEQVAESRDLEGTFTDQITSADLIVLNKLDLVEDGHRGEIEERLRAIEPDAPLVRCVHGAVDLSVLFPPALDQLARDGPPPARSDHHHEAFETRVWRVEPGIHPEELERKLDQPDLLRAKGFVDTSEGLRLVQVVGHRVELSRPDFTPDPEIVGRIVMVRRAS
jgi:cobalamin biosynthesis protein CobW